MSTPSPLARYHQALLAVSGAPAGLNLAELVRETGLPRSTTHRIASALCGIRYLEVDSSGTYSLGPAFVELLRRSLTSDNRLPAFEPALEFLVSELEETAFFARLVDGNVNLALATTPPSLDRSYIYPGTGPRPLDACSSSKAILAFAAPELVESMFKSGKLPLDGHGSLVGFINHLHEVSRDGYAVCDGEIDEGVYSLSCPVHVGPMRGLYSIGVVGPRQRMTSVPVEQLVKTVRRAAEMASERLIKSVHVKSEKK